MIMKCDICKQEELIPNSLIRDREITGGIRHSDWSICLKTLLNKIKELEQELVYERRHIDGDIDFGFGVRNS